MKLKRMEHFNKDFLEYEHYTLAKSFHQIADEMGVNVVTIRKYAVIWVVEEILSCKHCGDTEDLKLNVRWGSTSGRKYQNICNSCYGSKLGKSLSGIPKTEEHKQKLRELRLNTDNEIEKERIRKFKETMNKKTEEDKKISKEKFRETYASKDKDELNEIYENRSKSRAKVLANRTEEETKRIGENISNGHKKRTDEQIKESIKAQHLTKKQNGTNRVSEPELKCLDYIKQYIDKDIIHQIRHEGYNLDFYSPKYDLYIQFDGDYWHGYLNTKEELEAFPQGRVILTTVERDKDQNDKISNLVRIRSSEFKDNRELLLERVKEKSGN